jgi:cysteine desulfurase
MKSTDRRGMAADGRPGGWPWVPVYLDYNATTPVDARVTQAAQPYWDQWFGNPSSDHVYGEQPRQAVARAREQVAKLIGAAPDEIVFTGSGSEADQLAIRGAVLAGLRTDSRIRPRVITQVTEHPAVLECCDALERWRDADVTRLPVNAAGLVDPEAVAGALSRPANRAPAVVSVMLANNETGTIQPIAEIADAAHAHGAVLHVDAAQAAGKIGIDVAGLGADLLTVVGHKMYAPKGVAALYVRAGTELEPVIYGGGQERRLRAGTENVALIAALGAAAELAVRDLARGEEVRLEALRNRLHAQLMAALPDLVELNGPPAGSGATSCSLKRPASLLPPGQPATAVSIHPRRFCSRWEWAMPGLWPRSGCRSAVGPPWKTSMLPPASSPMLRLAWPELRDIPQHRPARHDRRSRHHRRRQPHLCATALGASSPHFQAAGRYGDPPDRLGPRCADRSTRLVPPDRPCLSRARSRSLPADFRDTDDLYSRTDQSGFTVAADF